MEEADSKRVCYFDQDSDRKIARHLAGALRGDQDDIPVLLAFLEGFLPDRPTGARPYDPRYCDLIEWALRYRAFKIYDHAKDFAESQEMLKELMPDIRTVLIKGDGKEAAKLFLAALTEELYDVPR